MINNQIGNRSKQCRMKRVLKRVRVTSFLSSEHRLKSGTDPQDFLVCCHFHNPGGSFLKQGPSFLVEKRQPPFFSPLDIINLSEQKGKVLNSSSM